MSHHRFLSPRASWTPGARRTRPCLELLEDRTAPAVFVVNSVNDGAPAADGQLTLREAITAATTNMASDDAPAGEAGDDTIVFATSLQGSTITLTAGQLVLSGGGPLSIVGPGGVPSGITVDANGTSRVLDITSGDTVLLANLTLRNGDPGGTLGGGGIRNAGPTTLTNVVVTGNTAFDGGGIYNTGVLTLNNTAVSNNTANQNGGGIENTDGGTVNINTGSRITGNSAAGCGGGLENTGVGSGSTVTITEGTIAGNTAGSSGGGIENAVTMTIRGSTISENVAGTSGGGIESFSGATLHIVNSTLAGNLADFGGGALLVSSGTVTLNNVTVARNAATSDGGGIRRTGGTVTLNNSIVALNLASTNDDVSGVITNNQSFIGTADGNPRLGILRDNGGPTFTLAPEAGSPVIDAGDNTLAVDPVTAVALTTDQRGFPRILDGTVDQGAVERFSTATAVMLEVLQDGMAVTGTSTALPVTLRATVMSSAAGITPTGSVNFYRDPLPTDPTDDPVQLNSTPIALNDMGVATLPNLNLPSTRRLFARFVPSSPAFDSSASQTQTITATIQSTVGVFDPNAVYQLLNRNRTTTTGPDFSYSFGIGGDQPVVGNWTGSSSAVALPGVVRNVGGFLQWTLADENPPVLPNLPDFLYGTAGQVAISGDWNGDGRTGIGVYSPGDARGFPGLFQLRNEPSAGAPNFNFSFGGPGDLPVVGDWDGDGADTVGVYRPATGEWFLTSSSPVSGDPGLFAQFTFAGGPMSRPVAGDWNGDGTDGIGVFFPQTGPNAGFGGFLLKQTASAGAPDVNGGNVILAGLDSWLPVAGNWGIAPTTSNELLNPSPLMLGEGGIPGGRSISDLQLQTLVDGALDRLASAGADPTVLNALVGTQFVLADLPGSTLGLADLANGRVLIDVDGAGAGWYVDGTPGEDSEFASGSVSGVDLLMAVLHEMGHVAGHDHDADGLMAGSLTAGVRHTDALDALFSSGPGHDAGEVAIP